MMQWRKREVNTFEKYLEGRMDKTWGLIVWVNMVGCVSKDGCNNISHPDQEMEPVSMFLTLGES